MGKLTDVPFAVQKGDAGITQNSREVLVNMFAEIAVSGRSRIVRRQRAGLELVYAIPGAKRCIEQHGGYHYCIIGSGLYRFDGSTATPLATLSSSSGRCTMIFNDNDEIMISDGVKLVYYDGALHDVTNAAGFVPGNLAYLNGYGLVNEKASDTFYITAANDFSSIDALDFATAESSPDALRTVFTDHNEAWLVGERTIEIWQDVGGSDFPFQPATNAKIERGTAAALSLAADDNTITFLGDDLVVYRAEGYRPVRISTYAVEEAIRTCSPDAITNAYGFVYTLGGNKFYNLILPPDWSGQYNFATGLWNETKTYGADCWDVVGSAGHRSDYVLTPSGISRLSMDVNADEGEPMVRLARSAPGWADGRRIAISEFMLDCEVGRAATGVSPEVMMRFAPDGETFGNVKTRSLGTIGNYLDRVVFRNLGQGRKPVIEVSASGDFRFAVMGTLINAEVGDT